MIDIIALELINSDNIYFYKHFETAFAEGLNRYQSRIYPNENAQQMLWYYIKQNSEYIGSVWLEKAENEAYAVLGIFIADEKYRNKGYGFEAIKLIIEQMDSIDVKEVHLNVRENNARAINCYRKIGFAETERYKTANGISAIKMVYKQ